MLKRDRRRLAPKKVLRETLEKTQRRTCKVHFSALNSCGIERTIGLRQLAAGRVIFPAQRQQRRLKTAAIVVDSNAIRRREQTFLPQETVIKMSNFQL